MLSKTFIDLGRHFSSVSKDQSSDDPRERRVRLGYGKTTTWEDLLSKRRVIILAEAGAGKTEEMLAACRKIRGEGKHSFFLRLEHLSGEFEDSFDEGSLDEFREWMGSGTDSWIFLDSVDEARLQGPIDFEKAIRRLAREIGSQKSKCHIYISSRVTEWRPISDLELITQKLALPVEQQSEDDSSERKSPTSENVGEQLTSEQSSSDDGMVEPEIFDLCSLNEDQISIFCTEIGLNDADEFLAQVVKQDAMAFASRPQDLIELIDFWSTNHGIGSRFELVQNSINERLKERSPDRAQRRDLPFAKAIKGATTLAAAVTLTKQSRIRIPDADRNMALDTSELLDNWSAKECSALLERPIFDKAIYGTVRFHHRVIREFLTAQWILELLKKNELRAKIEQLLFRNQYGCEVVVPTMRAVIGWIALSDEKVLNRAINVSPDVVVEFGDPSQLSLPARIQILKAYCKQQVDHHDRWSIDGAALLRFSHPDLVPTIRLLLPEYRDCRDVLDTLLLLILHGELAGLQAEVLSICKDETQDSYSRVFAIRALAKVGSKSEQQSCVNDLIAIESELASEIFAELLQTFGHDLVSLEQVIKSVAKLPCSDGHQNTNVLVALEDYLKQLSTSKLYGFIEGINGLLEKQPFCNDRSSISRDYSWLLEPSVRAAETIICSKDELALSEVVFKSLRFAKDFNRHSDGRHFEHELDTVVPEFEELNRKLFWNDVARARVKATEEGRHIQYWGQAMRVNSFWAFGESDFLTFIGEVAVRTEQDDKLVALSLLFTLYRQNGRPNTWYRKLKRAVESDSALESALHDFFHPAPKSQETKRYDRQEARFRKKKKASEEKEKKRHIDWQTYLEKNVPQLKDVSIASDGSVWNSQMYLFEEMRRIGEGISRWGRTNWRDLVPQNGLEIATAFRDGLVNYWRHYHPKIRSEGIENPNSVPHAIPIALSGLEIESREVVNWTGVLSNEEALLASRLALWEMNGFPDWLPHLHKQFPTVVKRLFLQEIEWELNSKEVDKRTSYIVHDTRWNGQWLFDDIAADLLALLEKEEPLQHSALSDCLWMLNHSDALTKEQIGAVARQKVNGGLDHDHTAIWFATWVDVDADPAIVELEKFVSGIATPQEADEFVVCFLGQLMGQSGRMGTYSRASFKSAKSLNQLFLLAKRHVRYEEDIQRAGKGCYTPTERDNAQSSRGSLYNMLADTPGKAAYLCLMDLAENHSTNEEKSWILKQARKRAIADSDFSAWNIMDVLSFAKTAEHTPNNHRELYDLVLSRLSDLKLDLEEGDSSIASILKGVKEETEHRKYIGKWFRDRANGKYSVPQEEELADAKRPDIRIHLAAVDAPVPIELKVADSWTGPKLFERLENQLFGDYLRDPRSCCGVFLLLFRGEKNYWETDRCPGEKLNFPRLIEELQVFADELLRLDDGIDGVDIVGVDLTKRKK